VRRSVNGWLKDNPRVASNKRRGAFLDSVNAVEMASSKGSETVCESPFCSVASSRAAWR
jgi:hypothetical protein